MKIFNLLFLYGLLAFKVIKILNGKQPFLKNTLIITGKSQEILDLL